MPFRSSLRHAALSLALFLPATLLLAQQDPLHTASRQELNIIKVLLAQENAWNKGDLSRFHGWNKKARLESASTGPRIVPE